jgi:hypothetical protein
MRINRNKSTEIGENKESNMKPEIEASSEAAVRKVAQQLGFEWADAKFGDVMMAYQAQYSHLTVNDYISCLASVKFGDPLPDLLQKSE